MLLFDAFDEIIAAPTGHQIIKEYRGGDDYQPPACRTLSKTANFKFWEGRLSGELDSVDLAGHIFHQMDNSANPCANPTTPL
jgi:hypothetical protein